MSPDPPPVGGLPVRRRRLKPGAVPTGVVIAVLFAFVAQAGALRAGLVWDDRVLVAEDPRLRDLGSVLTSFGDSFFGPLRRNEMYRPVVNASLALDWFLSGSTPERVRAGWFHLVNLLLHCANAGLVYLFLANLTKRRLGAPLLAAVLFAVHPLAVEPTAWIVGRCDLLAAFFGLLSGVLLLRSPGRTGLLWAAVPCYGLSLFAKASAATLPLVVAAGLVAYHGLPPARLLSRRVLPRFALFALPAAAWLAARIAVLGAPFPRAGGLAWKSVGPLDAALGVGRSIWIYAGQLALPARLAGDYAGDRLWTPSLGGLGATPWIGLAAAGAAVAYGAVRLRSAPRTALPLLGFFVVLLPVLQVVPIGAIAADRFLYLPMVFAFLLVGEGLERLLHRFGTATAVALTLALFFLFIALSHLRAPVWRDDVTFNRDVLVSYPHARDARHRLALALSERQDAGDDAEAVRLLEESIANLERPDEELSLLGAVLLEQGRVERAEEVLRRAVAMAGAKRLLGAQARYNLAVALRARGRHEEARALLREALDREPGLAPARALLERL